MKGKKIINIIIDAFIISIAILILFLILGNYPISMKEIIKMFLPITLKNNWFISCYLLFYAIHPFLNLILDRLEQKQLLKINMVFILYIILNTFKQGLLYYNDLVGFIIIYFIISYLKKYKISFIEDVKMNRKILYGSISLILIFILFVNFIGLKINSLNNLLMRFCTFINPLILICAISVFNLMISKDNYSSKKINYISGLSLYVYMIHDNYLVREYLRGNYFTYIYINLGYKYIVLYSILLATILAIFSIAISAVYKKKLQDKIHNICYKIYEIFKIKYKRVKDRAKINE